MRQAIFGIAFVVAAATALIMIGSAASAPAGSGSVITDRKGYIPLRKHILLQGKAIGILVADPQPVLSTEGRTGPKDQLCFAVSGASYRWVYVPVEANALISSLSLPVGQDGQRKKFDKLSMATPTSIKQWGIDVPLALVEVEVNEGLGSPASDSFVATKMRRLDGSKDYPLNVAQVIGDLQKRYDDFLRDQVRQIDEGMTRAAAAAIKDKKPTGPRERKDLMFLTWLPETERLRVHFRTTISDGDYQYANGIRVEVGAARTPPLRPGNSPPSPVPNGLRYGKQFGVELGMAYEVSKSGKLERTLTLPLDTYRNELPQPAIFNRPATSRTMKAPP